jgi:hypothetical protein
VSAAGAAQSAALAAATANAAEADAEGNDLVTYIDALTAAEVTYTSSDASQFVTEVQTIDTADKTAADSQAEADDAEAVTQAATDAVFTYLPDILIAPTDGPTPVLTPDYLWGYEANEYYVGQTNGVFLQASVEMGIGWVWFRAAPSYAGAGSSGPDLGAFWSAYGAQLSSPLGNTPGIWGPPEYSTTGDLTGFSATADTAGGVTFGNPIVFTPQDMVRNQLPEAENFAPPMHFTGNNAELLDLINTPSNTGPGGYSQSPLPTTQASTQLDNPAPTKSPAASLEDVPAQSGADAQETRNEAQQDADSMQAETGDANFANTGPAGTLTLIVYVPQTDAAEEPSGLEDRCDEVEEAQANEPAPELKSGANAAAVVGEALLGAVLDEVHSTVSYKVLNAAVDLAAQLLSSAAAVGHHYVNVATVQKLYKQGRLSDGAYYIAMGFYSGATEPVHQFGTYGGVTHATYNKEIEAALVKELDRMKAGGRPKMSGKAMLDFIQTDVVGGAAKDEIKNFNRAVLDQARAFQKANPTASVPSTLKKDLIAQGKEFVKNNGPRIAKLGAVLLTMSGADQVLGGILESADEKSRVKIEFNAALKALEHNDVAGANLHIIGNGVGSIGGMAGELRIKGMKEAAAALEKLWMDTMRESQLEQYEAMAKLNAVSADDETDDESGGAGGGPSQGEPTGNTSSNSASLIDLENLLGKIIALAGGSAGETFEAAYKSSVSQLAQSDDPNAKTLALMLYLEMLAGEALFDAAAEVFAGADVN